MLYFKKSFFGFIFLLFFALFHFELFPLLVSYDWIFGIDTSNLLFILGLAAILLVSAFSFVVFASLSQDYRLGLVFALLGAVIPLIFNQEATGVFLAIGYFILLVIFYFSVDNKMKKYLTFDPGLLLGGSIKTLTTLLTILVCFSYYLSINSVIAEKGFTLPDNIIPDALIEQIINQQSGSLDTSVKGDKYIAQITPEMIEYAKQHPELLEQYGVTPEQLDQIQTAPSTPAKQPSRPAVQVPTTPTSPPTLPVATVKKLALEPINAIIKQYQNFVAPVLAFILFSGFSFSFFLLHFLTPLATRSVFYILEKTNFIHFDKEMREVKKLVV